jgi:hypothetical protein
MGWNGLNWCGSGCEPVEDSFEHRNNHFVSSKWREMLELLRNWPLLKVSAP